MLRLVRQVRRLRFRRERGSVTVMVAVTATVIIGLAALGTDVGRLFLARQRAVSVADAAAISGAQFLPQDRPGAIAAVQRYLDKNGVAPEAVTIAVNDVKRTVTVTVEDKVAYTFAKVLGQSEGRVHAQAVAQTAPLSGYNNVIPLGVARQDWKLGDEVILKHSPGSGGGPGRGNYGALTLGGRGAASYEQNLRYGHDGWVRVGDWLTTEPGNMTEPTQRAIEYRMSRDPYATYETVRKGSDRVVIIPVLESFEVNGRGEVKVAGLAAFFLEGVGGSGNDKGTIRGRFLRYILTGESNGTGSDFATYTVKLTY